jgi:sensor c-di-GMP phosphodiesterase-like protein
MDACLRTRCALELDLRNAVAASEFEVYYQPLVTLETGLISGFEALLRWHHPVRGMVAPADFVPLAEEIGLIMGIARSLRRGGRVAGRFEGGGESFAGSVQER